MSKLRNVSREGWMVFTAVLAAIAVIAAMVTVPGAKAQVAEPTDFAPNTTLGNELKKEEKDPQHFAADYSWGLLVWAGEPAGPGFNNGGNQNNDVGWAWCIEPHAKTPLNTFEAYEKKNATKLEFDERYHDAVINLGRKMEAAAVQGDKKSAANYYVYLLMFLNSPENPKYLPYKTIVGNSKDYFPGFTGSHEEFTALTGYKIEGTEYRPQLVNDPTVEIAKQPADAFITVVHPNNNRNSKAQSVIPVDQPGLPDEPDNGGDSEEPTTSPETPNTEEKPTEETSPESSDEETTSNSETTENTEPSSSESTTPKDTTSETTPDKTTDVVPNPEPTPTTSEQEKDLEPKIETEASIKDGNRVEKGVTVIDTVTYEDLVPGKNYTLKAKLISKADGKTVLGEGSAEFVPNQPAGEKNVEIIVNDNADPAVDAAVAFEKLVSTEVDKHGEETPNSTDENTIATHEDLNDEKQTVNTEWKPEIHTNADFDNATQVKAGVTVKDTVKYTDLVPGKEYTLKAELISKEDGETVLGTGEATFTPEKSSGEQVVNIKVNDDVEGVIEAAVAFEELTSTDVNDKGEETPDADTPNEIAEHKDINDEDQTVTSKKTPKISTNADFEDGSHEVVAGAKIVDEVSYEGLVPGKEYTLKAELISKEDGKSVLGTGEKTFTPKKSEGMVPVTITVNDDVTEPVEAAVAFEELTSTDVNDKGEETPDADTPNEIAEHKDINDEAQTVKSEKPSETTTPETTTSTEEVPGTPSDGDEGETSEPSSSEETSSSEQPSTVESSTEKTEPTSSTTKEDSTEESTTSESSSKTTEPTEPSESTEPSEPENPGTPGGGDEKTPKISTNADFEDGSHEVVAGAKIVDEVSYEGLVPGKEYTLKAELISKEDGKSVLGTGEKTFTPKKSEGMVPVTITVNDDVTEPVEAAVAFEELTSTDVNDKGEETPDADTPNEIAEHKDINDEDQTVTSKKTPKISTNADFEDGSHEVVAGAKIVDEVSYEGLVPGKEYTLKAELISKEDGKSVLGTGEKTFTPKKSEGMVPVTITVNDDVTEPVEAAVAFEELTSTEVNDKGEETPGTTPENPNHIAEHKDINDDNQTVTSHEVHDQDAPKGGNSDNGNGRGVEGQGQKPEEIGNALPSNAERVEIKSVPSGATKLEPGMQDYIK